MNLLESNLGFKEWPKIPRFNSELVSITEKMNGTNSCIIISNGEIVGIQSRKRFIFPEGTSGKDIGCDNFGFALWVSEHEEELKTLGDGHHYGEWCGPGIQKNPHNLEQKEFYLFNYSRWSTDRPACCNVVKQLYFGQSLNKEELDKLVMLPLWEEAKDKYIPEGVIVYSLLTKCSYKHTFENSEGKWKNGN